MFLNTGSRLALIPQRKQPVLDAAFDAGCVVSNFSLVQPRE